MAGSARATARPTTPRAASASAPRRKISSSRPIRSSPTARFRSADRQARFDHELTPDLSAAKRLHEVAGAPLADRRADLLVLRRLSDAAQPELLVDVWRHPRLHARFADHHRHRAGDALHAA